MSEIDDIIQELDLKNKTYQELLDLLETVNPKEINNIKAVSVIPLPTVVKDREADLKGRMVNIVADKRRGMSRVLDIRMAIIKELENKIGEGNYPAFDTKQDIETKDLGNALDEFTSIDQAYTSLYLIYRESKTRGVYKKGEGKTNITEFLGLNPIIDGLENKKWTLHFLFLNSDTIFRILILFRDNDGAVNYAMELNSTNASDIKSTGWIDLNYLSEVKSVDTRQDADIEQFRKDITFNRVGLLYASDYDPDTGIIELCYDKDIVKDITFDPLTGELKVCYEGGSV